ncbi:MAG: hypothetical protein HFI31_06510 [Lachnospiraceae bacterium]|jgi:hypothetical protein|nr:hypothetical protein [Lachnospiraceae bacterium]MCI8995413.1 hypothetical protein [Lachnospiraceae bacterium]MCI9133824.1 hypothetical protein [Lachnospiraceae bacterium]
MNRYKRRNSIAEVLSGLTNLTTWELNCDGLSDIEGVSGLTNLTAQRLNCAGLSDIEELSGRVFAGSDIPAESDRDQAKFCMDHKYRFSGNAALVLIH